LSPPWGTGTPPERSKTWGNVQNLTDLIQYGSEADDFEVDEVSSSIEMSPTNTTCDQQVDQAATTSG